MHAARDVGAGGAKIIGAGGGCIVALVRGLGADAVASAINDTGGRAIITKASEDGIVGGSKLYEHIIE